MTADAGRALKAPFGCPACEAPFWSELATCRGRFARMGHARGQRQHALGRVARQHDGCLDLRPNTPTGLHARLTLRDT